MITAREPDMVEYLNISSGERWRIHGECNCCGECEPGTDPTVFSTGKPIGTPGAVYRQPYLPDVPIRPELCNNKIKNPHCSLTGEYL